MELGLRMGIGAEDEDASVTKQILRQRLLHKEVFLTNQRFKNSLTP